MTVHHFAPLMPHLPTPLEEWREQQHEDLMLASDFQFKAYLSEVDPDVVLRDRTLSTVIERRHLARIQGAA